MKVKHTFSLKDFSSFTSYFPGGKTFQSTFIQKFKILPHKNHGLHRRTKQLIQVTHDHALMIHYEKYASVAFISHNQATDVL
jgi:hypothetical protein